MKIDRSKLKKSSSEVVGPKILLYDKEDNVTKILSFT